MITYTAARELLIAKASSFGKERIRLEEAYGRVLSEKIWADRDYPPFARSSVDGYAISCSDLEQGLRQFMIIGTLYAGETTPIPIRSGECYKIMTGAPVPAGANAVLRREDTEEAAQTIIVGAVPCRPFINISGKGEDMRGGDIVIEEPRLCDPALMSLLASLGRSELMAERLPRVALFTTGNEVVQIDKEPSPVQIRNSNRWLLQSFLRKWGIAPSLYAHIPDDRAMTQNILKGLWTGSGDRPCTADLVILSGGVSAGDADHVPGVLAELGVRKLFHKLSIKPGKPAWCGIAPDGGMVFALPGNPFSCLVGFVLLIQPWLHASFGLPVPGPLGLPLRVARKKRSLLDEFFPVRVEGFPAGLEPVALNGSGDVRLGSGANALAHHPAENADLAEGIILSCYPF